MSMRVARKIVKRSQWRSVVRRAVDFHSGLPDFRKKVGRKRTELQLFLLARASPIREQVIDRVD